ncbi:pyridoxal phosphate-dependent transferase [Lentinula lateritia]|uniref:Pyridoxal phosphate-dependent transferase n=1 Tax=Lentinula aff. lateritia TaxID=2804960 RepID=A0ACC1UA05_9AGAR|nr:pyridoxal phosphate-dependent transferase [Lentinula aff. lateritia]KAJ3849637.1 pyridoxal phosphate-dependent transferase [Lentinula lateritia]
MLPLGESYQLGSLGSKLHAALASREARSIRRRLPEPSVLGKQSLIDFTSNDYLSLSTSPLLRERFLQKITKKERGQILGSAGSRLLVNPDAHHRLERRLESILSRPSQSECDTPQVGILFNSGFDANVSFFTCIPQPGDLIVLDEYIHASVWDGVKASRITQDCVKSFQHNSIESFCAVLESLLNDTNPSNTSASVAERLRNGTSSLFVAVESLYSMDGTLAPLREINRLLAKFLPKRNGYLIVDEAHATGIYGPPRRPGCGRASQLGLDECRVLARLHTFGKALAGSGAILLTTPLLTSYLINYARPLIYTTALAHPNVVLVEAAFDLMVEGETEQLSTHLLALSSYLASLLQSELEQAKISPEFVCLPPHLIPSALSSSSDSPHPAAPIIPLLTPYPRPLSAHLLTLGMNARPITWPTVPRGKERVRVCLHSGNTRKDVEALVNGVVEWARAWTEQAKDSLTAESLQTQSKL